MVITWLIEGGLIDFDFIMIIDIFHCISNISAAPRQLTKLNKVPGEILKLIKFGLNVYYFM